MDFVNTLWVEKYRPKKIEDLVLPQDYRGDFESYIKKRDIPNLLLYGPPGSGKTTIARIISSKNGILSETDHNLLKINGSSKETRGITFANDVIEIKTKSPTIFINISDWRRKQFSQSNRRPIIHVIHVAR